MFFRKDRSTDDMFQSRIFAGQAVESSEPNFSRAVGFGLIGVTPIVKHQSLTQEFEGADAHFG